MNKYKNLFQKQDGSSEPDLNNSSSANNDNENLFDLSALHKRNERHRQIQASRSGIYDEIDTNTEMFQTQKVQPGRFSNLKQRPSPSSRLKTTAAAEGSETQNLKRVGGKLSQMKLNPNFIK